MPKPYWAAEPSTQRLDGSTGLGLDFFDDETALEIPPTIHGMGLEMARRHGWPELRGRDSGLIILLGE
jgi:hypothetical protein